MANTHSIDLEAGSSQTLSIADASQTGLDLSTALTLEAWIKLETVNTEQVILSKYKYTGSSDRSYAFYVTGSNYLLLGVSDKGSNVVEYTSSTGALSANTWYHVAVTYDVSTETAKFYRNGQLQTSSQTAGTSMGASLYNSAATFYIGTRDTGASSVFDGLIDDVRVWSIVRTGTEINDNKSIEINSATNLQGSWHLNNSLADSSGNGNTLTNNNSATFSTDHAFDENVDLSVSVFDSSTITESLSRTLINNISVNDSTTVSEFSKITVELNPNVNDTVVVSEAINLNLENNINVNDPVTVTENSSVYIDLNINISDAITITENITLMVDLNIVVNDSVTILENVTIDFVDHEIFVFDSSTVTESASAQIPDLGGISVSDSITVTENLNVSGGDLNIEVSDLIITSETRNITLENNISVVETITVTENTKINLENNISVNDAVTVSENSGFLTVWAAIAGVVHQRSKQQSNPIAMDVIDTVTLNNKMQSRPITLDNNEIL